MGLVIVPCGGPEEAQGVVEVGFCRGGVDARPECVPAAGLFRLAWRPRYSDHYFQPAAQLLCPPAGLSSGSDSYLFQLHRQ
jgi:hypothetical protein